MKNLISRMIEARKQKKQKEKIPLAVHEFLDRQITQIISLVPEFLPTMMVYESKRREVPKKEKKSVVYTGILALVELLEQNKIDHSMFGEGPEDNPTRIGISFLKLNVDVSFDLIKQEWGWSRS